MRKFRIEGIKFKIANMRDMSYKYRVDVLDKNMWVTIGKCNTLASGKELIYNYIEVQIGIEDEEYNNLYTTSNSTTADTENLADTGIGDSSVVALIVIVSAVVAIYSARKANEYKNV